MTAIRPIATSHTPRVSERGRMAQLDGLRCFAVLSVVVAHTALLDSRVGVIGEGAVRLFFVLSAFLITGILLRARGPAIRSVLGRFYLRRTLRIFPAYFLLIAVLVLADLPSVREDWPWHALYATNWLIALKGFVWYGHRFYVGPLWSLSVEEQFYLVWPLLVLTVPVRWQDRVFVAIIPLAVVFRGAVSLVTGNEARILDPTPASLDALALGALLAWRWHMGKGRVPNWLLPVGAALLAHAVFLMATSRGFPLLMATRPLGSALMACWVIDRAAIGFGGWVGWLLTTPPVQYIGRISYGVYLWHFPVAWALHGWRTHGWFLFVVDLAVTLALASLSWVVIETPFNRLKNRSSARPAVRGSISAPIPARADTATF